MSSVAREIVGCPSLTSRQRVTEDIEQVVKSFPTLKLRIDTFVHRDGRDEKLPHLVGTLPMSHLGRMYNIPVRLIISSNHPNQAPTMYVDPTAEMAVAINHPYVLPDGQVNAPYLQGWTAASRDRSSLFHMLNDTSTVFGQNPPLYQKQTQQYVPQQYVPQPGLQPQQYAPQPGLPGVYMGLPVSVDAVGTAASRPPQLIRRDSSEETEIAMKNSVIEEVTRKIRSEMRETLEPIDELLKSSMLEQKQLAAEKALLEAAMTEFESMHGSLVMSKRVIEGRKEKLEAWAQHMEASTTNGPVAGESDIVAYDALSAQINNLVAECRAIDDALYHLDSTLSSGSAGIDLSDFLKESKKLSRKLFLNRAHLKKIAAHTGTSLAISTKHASQMYPGGSSYLSASGRGGGY